MLSKISNILRKTEAIKESHEFSIVSTENVLYAVVSCDIVTSMANDYYIVEENGCIYPGKRFIETTDYISDHNKGFHGFGSYRIDDFKDGVGDGVAIINLTEGRVDKLLYFRDLYNMPCRVKILPGPKILTGTFVVLQYSEYSYVLNLPLYNIDVLSGTNTEVLCRFILCRPYFGYEVGCCGYYIFDVLTKQQITLSSGNGIIGNEEKSIEFCKLDDCGTEYLIGIRNDQVVCKINIENLQKTKSIDLNELFLNHIN